jgi:energy-converting hydrogenase A subunit R
MDFPVGNTYCTRLDLDRYEVPPREAARLKAIKDEISSYPMIDIPDDAEFIQDFSEKSQAVIQRLDTLFWEELPGMTCGRILEDITPVGGEKKAKAVMEIVATLERDVSDVVYVGDSITDVQALQRVKEGGGVAISFNGNRYAVTNAEIAVLSDNAIVTSMLVDAFYRRGKKAVLELARRWRRGILKKDATSNSPIEAVLNQFPSALPQVQVVDEENVEELVWESSLFRKRVRGEAIGRLG